MIVETFPLCPHAAMMICNNYPLAMMNLPIVSVVERATRLLDILGMCGSFNSLCLKDELLKELADMLRNASVDDGFEYLDFPDNEIEMSECLVIQVLMTGKRCQIYEQDKNPKCIQNFINWKIA
ncbi:hypothetical protein JTE90_014655 [Oedothorax gibbosus]|uniref:Uncharacterized protein n=1 Tax=Oedothorax gibbosus TaxID=931172 RepID=A0AAV6VA90_9ARAC|nr:hypothetical protein JTE90_014655 [Oedothorax gibbosus]